MSCGGGGNDGDGGGWQVEKLETRHAKQMGAIPMLKGQRRAGRRCVSTAGKAARGAKRVVCM